MLELWRHNVGAPGDITLVCNLGINKGHNDVIEDEISLCFLDGFEMAAVGYLSQNGHMR